MNQNGYFSIFIVSLKLGFVPLLLLMLRGFLVIIIHAGLALCGNLLFFEMLSWISMGLIKGMMGTMTHASACHRLFDYMEDFAGTYYLRMA